MENNVMKLSNRKFLLFIKNIIKDIPSNEWCIKKISDNGKYCLLGHLGNQVDKKNINIDHSNLVKFFDRIDLIFRKHNNSAGDGYLVYVNDNFGIEDQRIYSIDNPKDRVIKAINLKLANRL